MSKVAIFIINYNMPERTNNIYTKLKNIIKYPHDIIIIDNGSDIKSPSEYTTIRLKYNVQTCNGFLMGLHYADALEKINNETYFAYCFIITSTEIITNDDFIEKFIEYMHNDNSIVAIHPALTEQSTTHWKHLITDNSKNIYQVNMIDNICSFYRADWFNKIGRFDANQTYAWGIDIETCYLARLENKKILLDTNYLVEKITDIGYKMNRMNMGADERRRKAYEQMNRILKKKYKKIDICNEKIIGNNIFSKIIYKNY